MGGTGPARREGLFQAPASPAYSMAVSGGVMNVRSIWSLRGRARPAWAAALAATLAVLGGPGLAAATTYYVGPGGNDGNAGTSSSAPWATTAKANSTMNPG